jgi:glutamate-1-semialdehyde 2,1-aminomutase
MVTYGKTLGGGLPVGVVCGRHHLMKRFREDRPVNVSFARGTFNSHPYVMGAMNEFLHRIEQPEIQRIYENADAQWNARVAQFNEQLIAHNLPVRIVNMHSILTVLYTIPGRYNWMLQFYLKSEGLELSWIGTGRMIMSLNYTDHDFNEVVARFIAAAEKMRNDGWWWQSPELTDKSIKRQMLMDMLTAYFPVIGKITKKSNQQAPKQTVKEGN